MLASYFTTIHSVPPIPSRHTTLCVDVGNSHQVAYTMMLRAILQKRRMAATIQFSKMVDGARTHMGKGYLSPNNALRP